MSVINLQKRNTTDWAEMHNHLQSPDSKVFIDDHIESVTSTSMDLNVGDAYIVPGSNRTFAIPEDTGLEIKPKQSVVIITQQKIKLPYNIFGVVTGKGAYIFKGCFLSTGKIDPAFEGKLKIGFYNGGNTSITLKTGDHFATAFFLNTDATLTSPMREYRTQLENDLPKLKWWTRLWLYLKEHWKAIAAWAIVAIPTFLANSAQFLETIKGWLSQE